jgi:hypothetical protein
MRVPLLERVGVEISVPNLPSASYRDLLLGAGGSEDRATFQPARRGLDSLRCDQDNTRWTNQKAPAAITHNEPTIMT